MGIRDHPTAPRSPWKNGHVERLIGSIRRESLDHLIVFDEAQLRRVLKNYASYYNRVRTHLSLHKNAPDFRRRQKLGRIASIPILGGLQRQRPRPRGAGSAPKRKVRISVGLNRGAEKYAAAINRQMYFQHEVS